MAVKEDDLILVKWCIQFAFNTVFLILHLSLFVLAIKHRHDLSGIVWALLWVGEQIHMKPPKLFEGN